MGLFSRKTAEALDTTARAAYKVGTAIAGEAGGRAADAIATAVVGPVRSRINESCTCGDPRCKD